ncbi:MAG: tetratricopeptide repeat protein, partial [Chloroflexi bacterium]|nr:tetratricopeptide repeat protein [Chloroflexota bacterium]
MQWLKWSVIAFAGLVALGIFALVGPLLAITVPFFLWKDWFGARSSLNAQVPSLSTVPPGMLAVISFVAVGGAWYGLTGGFRAPANSTGTMAALSSDSPSNPASTSPAALAALAPAAIPTPQSTAIPGPASTPAPTPTSLPPAMQLEVLWGQSDWTSIVALLTPMRGGPGWTQELNNKLYAAYINRGKGYLKSNVTNAAIEDFNRAVEVNPGAGQAQLEIQTVKNQEAEA